MSPSLELDGVSVDIAGRRVVDDVSLTVAAGEVVGVVGANGCGKTTAIRAALGLVHLQSGDVRLAGRPVSGLGEAGRARLVGYLPQERRIGWNLPAWRVAALGAPHLPLAKARAVAMEALAEVEMADLAERGVFHMSGGERARVLLARLLVTAAPLLIADEPAAGLDPDAQLLVAELLRARAARGTAILVTLHDLTLAARSCDRLMVMAKGRVVAEGTPREALTPDVLAGAFALKGGLIDTEAGLVVVSRRQ